MKDIEIVCRDWSKYLGKRPKLTVSRYSDIDYEFEIELIRSVRDNTIEIKVKDNLIDVIKLNHNQTKEDIKNEVVKCIDSYIKTLNRDYVYYTLMNLDIFESIKDYYQMCIDLLNHLYKRMSATDFVIVKVYNSDKTHLE